MERHRLARALRIIPPEGELDPVLPAPDPPTKGWWIDPADPRFERYHDGDRWTDQYVWIKARRRAVPSPTERSGVPPMRDQEVPDHQGFFPLGAGGEGIPVGGRRAPGSARYPGKFLIWFWVGVFCAGFTMFWLGLRTAGGVGQLLSAAGAVSGLGAITWLAVSAWRGGFRPPGFGPDADPRARWLGSLWLRALLGGILVVWVTPALDRHSAAYDWLNRIGVVLAGTAALQTSLMGLYSGIFMREEWTDGPPGTQGMWKWNIAIGLGVGAFVLWITWDRILDALWIR